MDANEFLDTVTDAEALAKFPKPDQLELIRLRDILKKDQSRAEQFADDYRFRPEFHMYVFELFTPKGEAVFTEFNFKDEKSAKYAKEILHELAPDRYDV